jgi:hypothetical protein
MEAICCSETSVETQRTTRRYIPEDGTLHNHRCENLKSYNEVKFWEHVDQSRRFDTRSSILKVRSIYYDTCTII